MKEEMEKQNGRVTCSPQPMNYSAVCPKTFFLQNNCLPNRIGLPPQHSFGGLPSDLFFSTFQRHPQCFFVFAHHGRGGAGFWCEGFCVEPACPKMTFSSADKMEAWHCGAEKKGMEK